MNFFLELLVIGIGVFIVIKTNWVYSFTGPIEWAEAHLGTEGGTLLFLKLIGILFIFGSFLAMTGILGTLVTGIFGPLFGRSGLK